MSSPSSPSSRIPSAQPGLDGVTVLVVDDLEINRALITQILQRAGCGRVIAVGGGEEALAVMAATVPDCVLLDVMMPGMNGYEVCRHIRATPALAELPVIFQTALTDRQDRLDAFGAGGTDIISKPLEARELVARVRVHAANARMSRELRAYQARVESELADAWLVAKALMPHQETLAGLAAAGIDADWFIRPCTTIGGDLWHLWPLPDGRAAMLLADVSGHGIAAAVRAFGVHTLLLPPPHFIDDPVAVAAHLDRRLKLLRRDLPGLVAAVAVVLDAARGRIEWVSGGLRDAVLVREDGGVDLLNLSGLPFGLLESPPRQHREVAVAPGDRVVWFSDALIEHFPGDPPEEEVQAWVAERVREWPGGPGLAAHIGERFLESVESCGDDLLIVVTRMGVAKPAG
ncbi:response regulator [Magnetospirillum sp. UT-4]|uniref:response regulator n=1 Tax=Magnetospirillum sp. UT-4 TaxID=2681467 RepID=UPI00137FB806|nr:response regulator [Magnetospirillum sp. UT-4]CAA7611675.1 hypothetical protein MTBUT4_100046 [Magnetospirillum sp. UT-4]